MSEERSHTRVGPRSPKKITGDEAYVGRVLVDRYVLKRQIGEGGFGIVFEAEDRRLGRRVAAKVLSSQVAKNPSALVRFEIEAKAAAQIGHQGIVDVRDFGTDAGGTHFIIMEFIDGVDVAQVIRENGPLPLARCLAIAARVAQALAVAHDHGIIHRDLKPANIMLTRIGGLADFAKVLDFGISKITEEEVIDTPMTETGTVVGTPRYMAPEQGIGTHRLDHRVDIYALGVILYEMATNDVPFSGTTAYETLHLKASIAPPTPSELKPALAFPGEFDALIMRALDRDPDRRFASMWEFDVAIRRLLATVDSATAALVEPTPTQIASPRPIPETPVEQTAATKAITVSPRNRSPAPAPAPNNPVSANTPAKTEQPSSRRRWVVPVGIALAAAAVGVTALVLRAETPSEPPLAPVAIPLSRSVTIPDAPVAVDEVVELQLDISPRGATVEIDGAIRTDNPLRLVRGPDAHQLTVTAAGFVSQSRTITASTSELIVIHLERARAPHVPPNKPPRNPRQRFPDTPIEPK